MCCGFTLIITTLGENFEYVMTNPDKNLHLSNSYALLYSGKVWQGVQFDKLTVDDAPVKLNPININNDYVLIIVPYGNRYPIRQIITRQY